MPRKTYDYGVPHNNYVIMSLPTRQRMQRSPYIICILPHRKQPVKERQGKSLARIFQIQGRIPVKKYIFALCVLLCGLLIGCRQEPADLVGIIFERGHGSMWGNQFYIEVCAREITVTQYFPEGASDPIVREHVPITAAQWQNLTEAIQGLELEEDRSTLREKLFGHSRQDGGEFRYLILQWETQQKKYKWPQTQQANALEAMLEQLAIIA